MRQTIQAIYDGCVLRPLETSSLRPQQRVLLRSDETPDAAAETEAHAAEPANDEELHKWATV